MSLHRRNPKRDKNERSVINAFAKLGVKVWQLSERGLPDLILSDRGRLFLVEVKNGAGGSLTESQRLFFQTHPETPSYIVDDPDQAPDVLKSARTHYAGLPQLQ